MEQTERPAGAKRQTLILIVGIAGAMLAFDAVLLFFVLLFTSTAPYIDLVTFLIVPLLVIAGGGVAWKAFVKLQPSSTSEP